MTETASDHPTSVADALTREHRQIDAGIEAFVAGAGAGNPVGDVSEWAAPLLVAMAALRRHIYLEEEFVFPPIRAGGLVMAIMVMLREHGELWRAMDELTDLLETAADDPARHEELVQHCSSMLELLEAHNSKEEPIIYTRADADLPAEARAELQDFLRRGTMPDGWVCERAAG
ncbi:MAG TPA: hemerythrin domain-containing protein [Ruania sp.]|nr:hemerythrin domain-containing protein [Ruania sp.]